MNTAVNTFQPTALTTIRRGAKRASFDKEALYQFIDTTLLCFIGFTHNEQVRVIPTCQWRDGDYIYWHGHAKAGNVAGTNNQQKVCITIGEIDGLVMARSAFHHSINYHSAMIYGVPELIADPHEKRDQLKKLIDKISINRWDNLRPITDKEIQATGIMKLHIEEVSFKLRTGNPIDDEEDTNWPIWAGVIPLEKQWGTPVQDALQTSTYALPESPL